jgi:hypothetical protein
MWTTVDHSHRTQNDATLQPINCLQKGMHRILGLIPALRLRQRWSILMTGVCLTTSPNYIHLIIWTAHNVKIRRSRLLFVWGQYSSILSCCALAKACKIRGYCKYIVAAKQNIKMQHQLHNGMRPQWCAVHRLTNFATLQVSRLYSGCACLAHNVGMPGILLGEESSIKLMKIKEQIKYIIS